MATDVWTKISFDEGSHYDLWDIVQKKIKSQESWANKIGLFLPIYICEKVFSGFTFKEQIET